MINWRSYFLNTPDQGMYAKDAKASTAEDSTCGKLYAKDAKGHLADEPPKQDPYAKDAKAAEVGPFADLHTNFGRVETQSLEAVLRGRTVELWSDWAGRLFIVADEEDAKRLMAEGFNRGEIYTAAEARRIIAVNDAAVVAEIQAWKRRFDGAVREFRDGDYSK